MRSRPPSAFAGRERLGGLLILLLVWIGGAVVLSALLAPVVWPAVEALAPGRFPFQRVLRRVALVVAVALLVALRERIGVRSWSDLGLGAPAARRRPLIAAFLASGLVLAALFVVEDLLGTRVRADGFTAWVVLEALAGAAVIGLLEEGVLRGALLFPFGRLRGLRFWIANGVTSAIYASVHFARGGGRPGAIDWSSGWRVWADLGPALVQHGEAWWGLFATGCLFYALAWRQGHAWGAVGLHAGAVLALQIGGALTDGPGRRSLFLAEGLLPGYAVAVLAFLLAVLFWWRGEREIALAAAPLSAPTPSTAPPPIATAR